VKEGVRGVEVEGSMAVELGRLDDCREG